MNTTSMTTSSSKKSLVDQTSIADENQIEALRIAVELVERLKDEKKQAEEEVKEDDIDADIVLIDGSGDNFTVGESKAGKDMNYTGTSKVIKLPYVIGSYEFNKHPNAGLIYMGEDTLVE